MHTLGIGAAGELLVQYKLLKHGIDSSRMTVDAGIDLVMYISRNCTPATIQVKTKEKPAPAGGTGKPSLGWFFPDACPAQWLAFCDLSTDSAGMFTIDEARELARTKNAESERIEKLRAAVQGGTYQVDHQKVAAKIVEDEG